MMAFSAPPPPLTSAALNKMTRIVPGARAERQKTQKNKQVIIDRQNGQDSRSGGRRDELAVDECCRQKS